MERGKKIIQTSLLGIAVNLVLVAFKGAVGLATGSIAILLDAVNNMSDALSSVINILGTLLAGRQPDKRHPYGYGRIEHITSVTIALIVVAAGVTAVKESAAKLLDPQPASYTTASLVIIAVAVVVKLLLGRYVKRQGERYHSTALVVAGSESTLDAAISLSTLAAAFLSMLWQISIEGWVSLVISAFIIKAGAETFADSLNSIIGERVDSDFSRQLKRDISAHPKVLGAYDLVLHRYGPQQLIGSVHVEVPDDMSAWDIHHLSRDIMQDVRQRYGITLTVGVYATNTNDPDSAAMRERLLAVTREYPEILQMHGFYVDKQKMTVSFDLVIAFKSPRRTLVRDEVIQRMEQLYPGYAFTAVIDNDFSD